MERRLKEVLGVKVQVTPVAKGELDRYTGTSQTSKVRRLLDRRNSA
jgi:phenylacetate-coenzyme A ligase PaaK-like adenylate-forming protein